MEVVDDLRDIFASLCTNLEAELMEFDGEHGHVLLSYPPKLAASVLVNSLKGVSSRMIRKKTFMYPQKAMGWRIMVAILFGGLLSCGGCQLPSFASTSNSNKCQIDRQ
ncbi:putative transposase [Nitrosomonas cryotolerans]|nr:putative transposase [Nitrosomonas cryotolerans]